MPRGPNRECLAVREICSIVHDLPGAMGSRRSVPSVAAVYLFFEPLP